MHAPLSSILTIYVTFRNFRSLPCYPLYGLFFYHIYTFHFYIFSFFLIYYLTCPRCSSRQSSHTHALFLWNITYSYLYFTLSLYYLIYFLNALRSPLFYLHLHYSIILIAFILIGQRIFFSSLLTYFLF